MDALKIPWGFQIFCVAFFFFGNPEFLGGFPNCWDTHKKRPTIYQLHVTSCRIPLCKDSGGSCCPGEDVDRFSRKTISFFEDESFGASLGCVFLATWLEFAVFFWRGMKFETWAVGSTKAPDKSWLSPGCTETTEIPYLLAEQRFCTSDASPLRD